MRRSGNGLLPCLVLLFLVFPSCGKMEEEKEPVKTNGESLSGEASAPDVVLEIFPAFMSGGAIHVLVPGKTETWQFAMRADPHAHQQVKEKLSSLGLEAEIIHSTSWRQDQGQLVLTYLEVINQPEQVPEGFRDLPFENPGMVGSDATAPPPEIPAGAVISHALRHLAWLHQTDPAVKTALSPGWAEALESYQPQPAGSIEF